MARVMRVGYKTASGRNILDGLNVQFDDLIKTGIAPTIMAIDAAGPVYLAQEELKRHGDPDLTAAACLHYRVTGLHPHYNGGATYIDVPLYFLDPEKAADIQYELHRQLWAEAPELDPDLVWYGILNEPGAFLGPDEVGPSPYRLSVPNPSGADGYVWDNSEWLARHARRLLHHAARDGGRRLTVLEWTTGNPERWQWRGDEMDMLAATLAGDPRRRALGIHEYSLRSDMKEDGYLIGRYRDAYRASATWRKVTKIVTEFGWGKDGDLIPEDPGTAARQVIDALTVTYDPSVIGLGLWTANVGGKNSAWSGAAERVHAIYGDLVDHALQSGGEPERPPVDPTPQPEPTPEPDPDPTPEPTPQPQPDPQPFNLLENPGFEDGWYHILDEDDKPIKELQVPAGWWFEFETGRTGYGDQPWDRYVRPEVRVMSRALIPTHEHELFFWGDDSRQVLKIFKGNGAWRGRIFQTVELELRKRYWLTVNLFADLVKAYDNGRKVWADDPEQRDGHITIRVGNQELLDWTPLKPGVRQTFSIPFTGSEHIAQVIIDIRCNFALPQNGVFIDSLALEEFEDTPQPDPQPAPPPPAAVTIRDHMLEWSRTHDPDNADASLRKALVTTGFMPYGVEARTTHDGRRYAVQTGMDWQQAPPARAVAYAPTSNYNDIVVVSEGELSEDYYHLVGIEQVATSQLDPRWSNMPFGGPDATKTYAQWACLATSYYMMAGYLGIWAGGELPAFVQYMRERRVLNRAAYADGTVRYNTSAHALQTMYPREIESLGWVMGTAEGMADRIKERLRDGFPVPVRVDLNPATPAEEQHWPLIVGWDGDDWLMLDPYNPKPTVEPLSGRYDRPGEGDIFEALLYQWVDGDGDGDDPDYRTIGTHNMFWPDGRVVNDYSLPYLLQHDDGHQEPIQTKVNGPVCDFLKGDGNGHWERRRWVDGGGVQFALDTSHSVDRYYTLTEQDGRPHIWLPPQMNIGTYYARRPLVTIKRKADCGNVHPPYTDVTWAKLTAVHEGVTLAGVTFPQVYDLLVSRDADDSRWIERYWYGFGVVDGRWVGPLIQWWSNDGLHSVFNGIATPRDMQMRMVWPTCLREPL